MVEGGESINGYFIDPKSTRQLRMYIEAREGRHSPSLPRICAPAKQASLTCRELTLLSSPRRWYFRSVGHMQIVNMQRRSHPQSGLSLRHGNPSSLHQLQLHLQPQHCSTQPCCCDLTLFHSLVPCEKRSSQCEDSIPSICMQASSIRMPRGQCLGLPTWRCLDR